MKPPQRDNNSLLGAWERPALAWMAARLPAAVVPDQLTAFGLLGGILTACGYVLSRRSLSWLWLACVGLLINWLGDSLDGTLARLRRIERPRYGFFVDHSCDLFCQVITFVTLGMSPLAHFDVACLGLITFLIAFVYTLIIAQARGTMRITYFYFGPSEIRTLLIFGNLLTLGVGVVHLRLGVSWPAWLDAISIHDAAIAFLSIAGLVVITALAVGDARALNLADPPPTRRPERDLAVAS
jgi:archaetidylinositol phosphate synthase